MLHDAVAGALFFAPYVGWIAWEFLLQRRTAGRDRTRRYVFLTTAVGVGLIIPASSWDGRLPGPPWPPVAVGVALMVAGWGFRAWSVRTLGRWFTVTVRVEPGQRVVEEGPYRLIRHPSYTGMLTTLLGMGIALDSWASVAVGVALPLIGILLRIREEEAMLLRELGPPYREYARRTKRLVPGVW